MPRSFRVSPLAIVLPVVLALVAESALAQAWPARPIRLISPFSAGSTVDIMARTIAPPLGELLGQNVVVENRGGAGGNIGVDAVAKAAPDGYTLGIGTTGPLAINPHLMAKVPYDPTRDFAPVVLLAQGPNVLVVHPSVPARTVAELVALAKAKPGTLSYGSAGVGSTGHLAGELFRSLAGIDIAHVPYKGNQDALTDVIAGQIQIVFSGLPPILSSVQAGRIRALAIAGDRRLPPIPDVPTVAEAGLKGAEVMPWYGVIAPAGTPSDVVDRLNAAVTKVMAQPDVRAKFLATGSDPAVGTPAAFATLIREEGVRWRDVIRKAGIKAE
jgi:tripartite-type tricarboxylate transporter receptor subunit TctC